MSDFGITLYAFRIETMHSHFDRNALVVELWDYHELNVIVIPEKLKRQNPTGDSVTGKPMTNPAVVALDTSIVVAHRRRTTEIPSLA